MGVKAHCDVVYFGGNTPQRPLAHSTKEQWTVRRDWEYVDSRTGRAVPESQAEVYVRLTNRQYYDGCGFGLHRRKAEVLKTLAPFGDDAARGRVVEDFERGCVRPWTDLKAFSASVSEDGFNHKRFESQLPLQKTNGACDFLRSSSARWLKTRAPSPST
ncbi:hypothetical protein M427DRAFT_131718 [Gonapodya prolifera JEL478]|uniref:Uncharacterized protein n=1 Tax=Gonapodya prolifera (strain JEL478) TaxID=1344416 RepID=A0A139AST0_GONPJ|nr:hypothetical protein M427DRAFT_131718 [Gonapodya prolifera JEL478]|eukprot:KXS19724.1 hypothetical protein M427DRAFT_131718 [Gonapodya prolifera JEL478]